MAAVSPFRLGYHKRFRMERDLLDRLPSVPALPPGFAWVPWQDDQIESYADVKYRSFVGEIDARVFPNLAHLDGCRRLMREIVKKSGFCPAATWMIERDGENVATIQGVSDGFGVGAIQNLGVVESARGMGLGTALLLAALQGFQNAGLQRCMLEVTSTNDGAIRLYRRHGFRFRKTIYRVEELPIVPVEESVEFEWLI